MQTGLVAAPIIDTSMPVFIDTEGVSKEAIRWLWFAGDSIAPRRKRELREMVAVGVQVNGNPFPVYSLGGMEVNTACLLRTRGVLPRAMLSPLEISSVWMPQDLIPDGAETFRGVVTPDAKWTSTLPGLKTYPGEAIRSVLTSSQNDQGVSQGITEISSLRGLPWQEVEAMGIQKHFFPSWPKLPPTLRELEELIGNGGILANTSTFDQIAEEMLSACEQFRLWANERIKLEETLLAVGTTKDGWTYRLSDVVEQLMAQLEITPQSKALLQATQLQGQLNQSIGDMIAAQAGKQDVPVIDVLQKLQDNQNLLADALTSLVDRLTAPEKAPKTSKPTS